MSVQLRYFVPFKAVEGVKADDALKNRLLPIEGTAIDTSVNANKWQVPSEDLDFVTATLQGAQLRVDHAESVRDIIGIVSRVQRQSNTVLFKAEVGDVDIIEKIFRGYVTHVSIQVDSTDVECSKCKRPSRKDGLLIHLCPDAWEIVHKPVVRELSIVASPAYKNTEFAPVGFAAAMNQNQIDLLQKSIENIQSSRSLKGDDVGSRQTPQEPEDKTRDKQKEVNAMSESKDGVSSHKAQGVVNIAPGEQPAKQVTYEDLMNQLQKLEQQIRSPSASDAELDALAKKVSELEADIAKKASKKSLSKKVSDLAKKLSDMDAEDASDDASRKGEDAKKGESSRKAEPDSKDKPPFGEFSEDAKKGQALGKGIVATDEIQRDALGNYDWFKDLLKAHKSLVGLK